LTSLHGPPAERRANRPKHQPTDEGEDGRHQGGNDMGDEFDAFDDSDLDDLVLMEFD
jgi:hypothetical protein